MRAQGILLILAALLIIAASTSAFDYNREAQEFDARIENLIFVMGASQQPMDEGDEQTGLQEAARSLSALKQDYREMIEAMGKEDANKAAEKREHIITRILNITSARGFDYQKRDIDKIVGPWSGYEIEQIRKRIESEKQQRPQPTARPTTPTPEPKTRVPIQAPTPMAREEPGQTSQPLSLSKTLIIIGAAGFLILLFGLYKFFKKKRYYNYCILLAFTIILLPSIFAGCVGNQCGDITKARVWTMEDVTLEDGSVIPAGSLICDSDVSAPGGWNSKCNKYCIDKWGDPECTGKGIAQAFKFKVEVTVKNTSDGTQGNYNTLIDGERLSLMHSCGGFNVRLTPGEEKTYTKENCIFSYNQHIDPNYPSLNGWFAPRGTCGRSLYCFKGDHHFTCKSQMFKVADLGNWAYISRNPIPGNNGQSVLGAAGIKVLSPNPSNCAGNCVYVNIGQNVKLEAAMKNYGPKKVCVKTALRSFSNWLDNLSPVEYRSLPDYSTNWEYFTLGANESKTKTLTFKPVIPGHWRIDWTKYTYYNFTDGSGSCSNASDYWQNAQSWYTQTGHTIYVRGPDAYLHGMYPPKFYFPPEEGSIGVETHLTVTTAYGTEAFTVPSFPLLVDMYYFDSGYLKAHKVSRLPLAAGLSKADLKVLQEFETDRILGVDNVVAVLKYDNSKDIPGVANDALMNEWMAKAGHQGSGSWCGEKCEYGYGVYRLPVDFVKFIDLKKQFEDFYYFDETEGYFYMEMNPLEERSLQLRMENPYLAPNPTTFNLATVQKPSSSTGIVTFYHGAPGAGNQTSTALIAAATSENYVVNEEYYIKIKAPESGTYDVNVEATPQGKTITDRIRIHLVVRTPPQADFKAVPREGLTPLTVDFHDKSTDDGLIVDWHWDFGDGSTLEHVKNPVHTYSSPEMKTVTLTVTDDQGMTDTAVKQVKPYTFASVEKVYAFDRVLGEKSAIAAECNKDHLDGNFEITNSETKEKLFQNPVAYTCNSGLIQPGPPITKAGKYRVTFKLDALDCQSCQKSKYFIVRNKNQKIKSPENPVIEALTSLALFGAIIALMPSAKKHAHILKRVRNKMRINQANPESTPRKQNL